MTGFYKDISFLVVSCDKYKDMWEPYFILFNRFWQKPKYDVFLMTNFLKPIFRNVNVIDIGEDLSWSDNLLKAVRIINSKYVFILLDDFFIVDKVRDNDVNQVFTWAVKNDIDYLHLYRYPRPKKLFYKNIGMIPPNTIYRVSTVSSLFKKEVLINLLKEGETAWDFEIKGSLRSNKYNGFFSVDEDLIPVVNGVIRGKWNRKIIRYFDKNNINYCISRPIFSVREQFLYELYIVRSIVFSLLPYNLQLELRNLFRS